VLLGFSITEIDACLSHPCTNGGTCRKQGSIFSCKCPDANHGAQCEGTTLAFGTSKQSNSVI